MSKRQLSDQEGHRWDVEDEGPLSEKAGQEPDEGEIIVADAFNNRLQLFAQDGEHLGLFAAELDWRYPYDCCVGPEGDLWVVEYAAARVTRLDRQGRLKGRYGGPGRGASGFNTPWGICVRRNGEVVVADTGNHRMVGLRR